MANINALFLQRSWAMPMDSKHIEASFLPILMNLLSRSGDFCGENDDDDDDDNRQTKPIALPCAWDKYHLVHYTSTGILINRSSIYVATS